MRCKRGTKVLLTLVDGQTIAGRVVWSWRWRVVRVVDASAMTPRGPEAISGAVLVPHRSIIVGQEVST